MQDNMQLKTSDIMKKPDMDFHINNFFKFYKDLINVDMYKKDQETFNRLFLYSLNKIKGVEYLSKPTLFISDYDLSKYIALAGVSTLPKLVSHKYMTLAEVVDIWWGNSKNSNSRLEDDEVYYSEQNIQEDLLIVYTDKYQFLSKNSFEVMNLVLSSRNTRKGKNLDSQVTWVFYKGTESSMRQGEKSNELYNAFSNDSKCQIINIGNPGISSSTESNINITNESSTNIEELY